MTDVLKENHMKTPMLDSMINIMEAVVKEQKPFSMNDFFANMPKDLSQGMHECGTAACIVGYCVTDTDFLARFLPNAHIRNSSVRDVCIDACYILEGEIGSELAGSIFEGTAEVRAERLSNIAGKKNSSTLIICEHVLSDSNCPSDALEYMKEVRSYLQQNGKPS
jgi:hypothetical protein